MDDRKKVPCKYCGKETPMFGTRLCDHCWNAAQAVLGVRREVLKKIIIEELNCDVEFYDDL